MCRGIAKIPPLSGHTHSLERVTIAEQMDTKLCSVGLLRKRREPVPMEHRDSAMVAVVPRLHLTRNAKATERGKTKANVETSRR